MALDNLAAIATRGAIAVGLLTAATRGAATDAISLSAPVEVTADGFMSRTRPLIQPASLPVAAQSPNAVRHVGTHDRTYIAYGNENCDPQVIAFDHETRQWLGSVRVGATPRRRNVHSLPAIAISPDGHVCVFFGGHTSPIQMVRGLEPESIDEWSEPVVITERGSYWSPYTAGGEMWLLHRDRTHWFAEPSGPLTNVWGYRISRDDGRSWSELMPLFALPNAWHPYPAWLVVDGPATLAHVFWLVHSKRTGWRDMRYMRTTDGAASWTASDGTHAEVPWQHPDDGERIFEGGARGFQNEIIVDSDGKAALLFVAGDHDVTDDKRAVVAYDTGDEWCLSTVCSATSRYNRGTMLTSEPGHLRVFFARGALEGGRIGVWETRDHGASWHSLGEFAQTHAAANPVRVHGAHRELQVLWCGGPRGQSIYGWGEAGTLVGPTPADPLPSVDR